MSCTEGLTGVKQERRESAEGRFRKREQGVQRPRRKAELGTFEKLPVLDTMEPGVRARRQKCGRDGEVGGARDCHSTIPALESEAE